MVFMEKGFDSRAQQEMSCLSSDWSCGLDNLFLSQIEIAYSVIKNCFFCCIGRERSYCNQVFAGLLREFCLTGVCIAVKGIGRFGTCGYWM
ncbi:hypothetical protein OIU77_002013 [Salix suchowensis]|uniref:Uncharacterized protein n=1 Tax=Salix suchowensis TaxID=1278906 RepID=A0ABQ9B3C8_9ROSI|nr:hypothetical protein OIU77_002013 [Salix suchowensis]